MSAPYLALNAALLLWSISLILWLNQLDRTALLTSTLAALLLLFHFLWKEIIRMFGKEKNSSTKAEKVLAPAPTPAAKPTESVESPQGNTVIASDVRFDGNIIATGMVYIHGKVYGNIESANGMIKIMRNGYVEGNIVAREVTVDGTIIGECHADVIDIQDHGKITGSIVYQNLAIKRGGEFCGQAEIRAGANNNVIDLATEKNESPEIPVRNTLLEVSKSK